MPAAMSALRCWGRCGGHAVGWMRSRLGSRPGFASCIETTGSAPATDAHGRHGGVSAAEGKRKERRSKTIDDAPSFGDTLAEGAIGAEHVDGLANATAKVDDDVRSQLLADESALVGEAASMTPEEFSRHCRDRVRQLERDHGIERNNQQRRDTFLSRKTNTRTGMVDGRFSFHPELANQIFGAVDKEVDAMVAAGERRGDTDFVNRTYDRRRLAAEALGTLIAGGHQHKRPLEADISMICDHHTALTGLLHDHGVCETIDGIPIPPATIRTPDLQRKRHTRSSSTPTAYRSTWAARSAPPTATQRRALRAMYSHSAFPGLRHRVRPLRDPPHPPLGTRRTHQPAEPRRCAHGITTSSTRAAGCCTSPPTAPSPSPNPTAARTPKSGPTSHNTATDDDQPQREARRPVTVRVVSGDRAF